MIPRIQKNPAWLSVTFAQGGFYGWQGFSRADIPHMSLSSHSSVTYFTEIWGEQGGDYFRSIYIRHSGHKSMLFPLKMSREKIFPLSKGSSKCVRSHASLPNLREERIHGFPPSLGFDTAPPAPLGDSRRSLGNVRKRKFPPIPDIQRDVNKSLQVLAVGKCVCAWAFCS